MKTITIFLFTMLVSMGLFSQTILLNETMDTYATSSFIAVDNPTWFTTWSNLPGSGEDAQILTNFAHSGTKSASADLTGGTTDCILKLGDKVSGTYEVKWWMYIENNKCGYYNFQHFQSPGIEWALEIYFRTNGNIELMVGGNTIAGTYPKAQWFEVRHLIKLDADSIYMYVNGVLLSAWPFSWQASTTTGTDQLGGVDLYAGAASGSGETAGFYFDDVVYTQIASGADPQININPASITQWVMQGTTDSSHLTVANTGLADLTFDVNTIYSLSKKKSVPNVTEAPFTNPLKGTIAKPIINPNPVPGGDPLNTNDTITLHYDGSNSNAIGWSTVPVTVTVAARFPNSITLPYAGLQLTKVQCYINNLNTTGSNQMTVKIYGMKNGFEPGALLTSQTFTPTALTWNTITLTTPITVTGEDLWVGYQFTQTDPSIYIPGCDDGSFYNSNGDFLSTGVGWTHLSSNPALFFNWNIRAFLSGTPAFQWLSVNPATGTIAPDDSQILDLGFNATTLAPGSYDAILRFMNNDPTNTSLDVPVTMDISPVGIIEHTNVGVMVYPNPGKDKISIVSNNTIKEVSIIDLTGNIVYTGNAKIADISSLAVGVYTIKVVTNLTTSNIKFIKN